MDADTMIIITAVAAPGWAIVWIVVAKYAFSLFAPVTAQTVASDASGTVPKNS